MLDRGRIIGFRLTVAEECDYIALRARLRIWSWSDLVREALRRLLRDNPAPPIPAPAPPAGPLFAPPASSRPVKKKHAAAPKRRRKQKNVA